MPCRFPFKAMKHPPDELVTPEILKTCRTIRSSLFSIISSCKNCFPVPDNLSLEARLTVERLQNNRDVIVTPVDKGGVWMVIPRDKYVAEANRQLSDTNFYAAVNTDLSSFTSKRLVNFLNILYKKAFISVRERKALEPPCNPRDRVFYLLPKAHKSDWTFPSMPPGRPIVSDTGSVSRRCASLIEYFLAPLAKQARSYFRDSLHLISLLDSVHVSPGTILFTMDITSLYTNIPTEDCIEAVSRAFLKFPDPKRPDLTLLSMLRLLLTANDFTFLSQRFLQLQGTAMGCAFGASYANIFLAEWEDQIYVYHSAPTHWFRFIDDCLGIWNYSEADLVKFHIFVNDLHPNIKVDLQFNCRSIRFLDLELYISGSFLLYKIGFKATDNHSLLSPSSFHPPHIFRGILFSQVYRWMTRSATYADFSHTKSIVQRRWREQGYTRSRIRSAVRRAYSFTLQKPRTWRTGFFPCSSGCKVCKYAVRKPTRLVKNFRTNASFPIVHNLSCNAFNVLYLITCTNCKLMYVGQTSRPLRTRIYEHLRSIRMLAATSVARHFTSECNVNHFSFTALEHCPNQEKRLYKENLWIKRLTTLHPQGLNEELNTVGDSSLRLILPFSHCSSQITSVCRNIISDVTVSTGHKTSANLRRLLKRS